MATHQPSTVNTQKGGLGESLLLLHGNPAAQGAQDWNKNGLCCHEALFARARQGGSVTRRGGMFVFVVLDFQNPWSFCGWQAPSFLCLVPAAVGGLHPCLENMSTAQQKCASFMCHQTMLGRVTKERRKRRRRPQCCSNLHYFYFLCNSHFQL